MSSHRLLALLPVLAAAIAFWPATDVGFVYDDHASLLDNASLRAGDFLGAAFGERHSPLANRPLPCLMLAIEHAWFGANAFGYRVVNLLVHAANALLLVLVLRSALLAPTLRGRFSPARADAVALAVATLWAAHPLAVDAVAYVTQRSTLLMGLFLLAALRCLQRGHGSRRPWRWHGAAAALLAFGMASKEEMAAAPLLLALYDRAFLLPSWAAMRARLPVHGAFAASWLVLAAVVALGPGNPTVGYATVPAATAWEWLLTQSAVVVRYAALALAPYGLRGAYDWPIVRDLGAAVLPGLVVLAALVGTVLAWRRWPWLGFLGAWFFLLLAPTSSVLPIVTEVVAERRAYLPMLALLVPAVVGADVALRRLLRATPRRRRRLAVVFAAAAVLPLVAVSRQRQAVYGDESAFWADAYAQNGLGDEPDNRAFQAANILSNHGLMLWRRGEVGAAHELFERAMQCEHPTPIERLHYAVSLTGQGRIAEAMPILREVALQAPDLPDACGTLGTCLLTDYEADAPERRLGAADPRLREAEPLLRRAIELAPGRAGFHNALGLLLLSTARPMEAEAALRQAIALDPARFEPYRNLVLLLCGSGRVDDARVAVSPLLAARPQDVGVRLQLAQAFLQAGDRDGAAALLSDALRLDPQHAVARTALDQLQRGR